MGCLFHWDFTVSPCLMPMWILLRFCESKLFERDQCIKNRRPFCTGKASILYIRYNIPTRSIAKSEILTQFFIVSKGFAKSIKVEFVVKSLEGCKMLLRLQCNSCTTQHYSKSIQTIRSSNLRLIY